MSDPASRPYQPQRAATRAPIGRPVRMQFDDSTDVEDGTCQNISIGGMFISLEQPRSDGKLVRFELVLDDRQSVRGLGEVIWLRPGAGGNGRTGMGVKFRFLEQRDRQMIFKLVSQHIKDRLSARDPSPLPAMDPGLAERVARARPDAVPTAPEMRPEMPIAPDPTPAAEPSPSPASTGSPSTGSSPTKPSSAGATLASPTADAPAGEAYRASLSPMATPAPLPQTAEGEAQKVDEAADQEETESAAAEVPAVSPEETTEPIPDPAGLAAEAVGAAHEADLTAAEEPTPITVAEGEPEVRPSGGLFDADRPVTPIDGPVSPAETALDYRLSEEENVDDEVLDRVTPAEPVRQRTSSLPTIATLLLVVAVIVVVLFFMRGRLFSDLKTEPTETPSPAAVTAPGDEDPAPASMRPAGDSDAPDVTTPDAGADASPDDASSDTESPDTVSDDTDELDEAPPEALSDASTDPATTVEPSTTPDAPVATNSGQIFDRVLDIEAQSVSDGLDVTVVTNGIVPPDRVRHFRLDGDDPREVVQLVGARRFARTRVDASHPLIDDIRIGFHRKRGGDELHVVIDLASVGGRVRAVRNLGRQLVIEIR